MDFKDHWDLDSALKVVQNKTVDAELWAEAIEWLLLYGPPEVVTILLQASTHATETCYPDLQTADDSGDAQTLLSLKRLAQSLGMPADDVRKIISSKEQAHLISDFFSSDCSKTVH